MAASAVLLLSNSTNPKPCTHAISNHCTNINIIHCSSHQHQPHHCTDININHCRYLSAISCTLDTRLIASITTTADSTEPNCTNASYSISLVTCLPNPCPLVQQSVATVECGTLTHTAFRLLAHRISSLPPPSSTPCSITCQPG